MEPRAPLSLFLAHLIDEDYQVRRESPEEPSRMRVQHEYFDPGERIPSYESSQEENLRHRPRPGEPASGTFPFPDNAGSSPRHPGSHANAFPNPRNALPFQNSQHSFLRFEMPRIREARDQSPARGKRTLKALGLKFLNARQHFLLAACRDLSLVQCVIGLSRSWWLIFRSEPALSASLTSARTSEHFLTGLWCLVAGYLSYSVLDGLMVRWIVSYTTTGSIVRVATMSAIIVVIESYLVSALSAEGYNYALHTWILISCALTVTYIIQNFITSNIDLKGKYRPRFFDFYNIVVFAVVPVGVASFITMIGLLRSLLILRLDIDSQRIYGDWER